MNEFDHRIFIFIHSNPHFKYMEISCIIIIYKINAEWRAERDQTLRGKGTRMECDASRESNQCQKMSKGKPR